MSKRSTARNPGRIKPHPAHKSFQKVGRLSFAMRRLSAPCFGRGLCEDGPLENWSCPIGNGMHSDVRYTAAEMLTGEMHVQANRSPKAGEVAGFTNLPLGGVVFSAGPRQRDSGGSRLDGVIFNPDDCPALMEEPPGGVIFNPDDCPALMEEPPGGVIFNPEDCPALMEEPPGGVIFNPDDCSEVMRGILYGVMSRDGKGSAIVMLAEVGLGLGVEDGAGDVGEVLAMSDLLDDGVPGL